MRRALWLILPLMLCSVELQREPEKDTVAVIQASYIYNIAKLVEWNDPKFRSGNFVIGVLSNSNVYQELVKKYATKTIGKQPIEVRKLPKSANVAQCHILFVGNDNLELIGDIYNNNANGSTLIITEYPDALEDGSVVNFVVVNNTLKYELSMTNAGDMAWRWAPPYNNWQNEWTADMNVLRHIFLILSLLIGGLAIAQPPTKAEVLSEYRAGDLATAQQMSDELIKVEEHQSDAEVWLIRGFIYKDVFKKLDKGSASSTARDEAMASLKNAMDLDEAQRHTANAKQAYEYLAGTYFNDAASALGRMEHEEAVRFYAKYQEAERRLDPKVDMATRDVEFYNALGTVYTKLLGIGTKDSPWFTKAVEAYEKVLKLDPENYGANYNMATIYFNFGVQNIHNVTPENDIPSLQLIQEVSKEYFLEALPYMLKAHELRPDRKETLLGLEGIYYSLQEQDQANKYRELFEALPIEEE